MLLQKFNKVYVVYKTELFRFIRFVFSGEGDEGQRQKQEPAGAQESISDQVSLPTRQERKTEGETVRHRVASLTFMYYTFRSRRVSLIKRAFLTPWLGLSRGISFVCRRKKAVFVCARGGVYYFTSEKVSRPCCQNAPTKSSEL